MDLVEFQPGDGAGSGLTLYPIEKICGNCTHWDSSRTVMWPLPGSSSGHPGPSGHSGPPGPPGPPSPATPCGVLQQRGTEYDSCGSVFGGSPGPPSHTVSGPSCPASTVRLRPCRIKAVEPDAGPQALVLLAETSHCRLHDDAFELRPAVTEWLRGRSKDSSGKRS